MTESTSQPSIVPTGLPATQADLVAHVADTLQLPITKAKRVVAAVLNGIEELTFTHSRLTLRSFGKFRARARKARVIQASTVSPESHVAARTVIAFSASPQLRRS